MLIQRKSVNHMVEEGYGPVEGGWSCQGLDHDFANRYAPCFRPRGCSIKPPRQNNLTTSLRQGNHTTYRPPLTLSRR